MTKKLSPTQKETLEKAMAGNGLWRLPGGFWVPWKDKDQKREWGSWFAGTQTVQALIDRGLLVPHDRMRSGAPYSVVLEWDAARAALANLATQET